MTEASKSVAQANIGGQNRCTHEKVIKIKRGISQKSTDWET